MKNLLEPQAPNANYQRYSSFDFPDYRYIPGINHHPVRHPQGHSYNRIEEKLGFIEPKDWQKNSQFLYGVDLYNYAFWWESHEAWEGLWHLTQKDDVYGQFLQGLIQVSAAFIKWYLNHFDGMTRLYNIALGRLEFVASSHPQFMGIDLLQYISSLKQHFSSVLKPPQEWPDPLLNYPFITLVNFS